MRRLKNKNWYQGLELLEYIHWIETKCWSIDQLQIKNREN